MTNQVENVKIEKEYDFVSLGFVKFFKKVRATSYAEGVFANSVETIRNESKIEIIIFIKILCNGDDQ
ncbi:MAG: hypothetical protein KIG83_10015 [Treponema sp.]|nr:hypothetical protein [Treponema sp.]